VSPGFTWKKAGTVLLALLPGTPGEGLKSGNATFKLSKITTGGTGRVAEIEVPELRLSLTGETNLKLTLKGTIRFGLDKGVILEVNLTGKAEVTGDPETGTGTVTVTRKVNFLKK
jgi:hypothetical protein